ncbi:collagen-like protein [Lacinutrix sp. Hel_I_90]|uniref:collagen-like triple helix repeat-containing protein n=1 Tax=Lacinutrix sp. Hel_I_90 TaxID=1249999 RepID=UPI0005C9E595|nr:collagen-like protein [Lacinutrix sp. Hel_I_90]
MKRILTVISVVALLLTSCEGPQGPPGRDGFNGFDGFDGADGGLIVSSAFEIEVNFNAANNYEIFEPYGFEVFPSDVTLVYILWDTIDGQDIWRLTPQNVFFNTGILTYNFDFTQSDVRLFLDGTIDFATLDPSYTQNQIFRIVVVPADNVDGLKNLDISDIESVMTYRKVESFKKK